jgi:hypothetical protein
VQSAGGAILSEGRDHLNAIESRSNSPTFILPTPGGLRWDHHCNGSQAPTVSLKAIARARFPGLVANADRIREVLR